VCLGIPGKVLSLELEHDLLMGKVEFGGVAKRVCLAHVPDVKPGDYVVVHVGFALSKIDALEAERVFRYLAEMHQTSELDVPQPDPRGAA
jgi:hydrogenase expression/formation protein HypC